MTHTETPADDFDEPLSSEDLARIDAAWEKHKAAGPQCAIPPAGWTCTRGAGHDGPCAAIAKQADISNDLLAAVIQYRDDLRRPPSEGSVQRRLAMVNELIAKALGRTPSSKDVEA